MTSANYLPKFVRPSTIRGFVSFRLRRLDMAKSQLARSDARLAGSSVNHGGQGGVVLPKVLTGGTAVLTVPTKVQASEGRSQVLLCEVS